MMSKLAPGGLYEMNQIETKPNKPIKLGCSGLLDCPYCNCQNLHQHTILSVFRDAEDQDGTGVCHKRQASVEGWPAIGEFIPSKVDVRHVVTDDIVGRRDILEVHLWCENCDRNAILTIMQHKGSTFLSWD